jgi:hypothetical protein
MGYRAATGKNRLSFPRHVPLEGLDTRDGDLRFLHAGARKRVGDSLR